MLNAGTWLLAKGDAKNYTDETVVGGGAIKGKNCTIESISKVDGVNTVTFQWTLDNGTVKTGAMQVEDGADAKNIKSAAVDSEPDSPTYRHLMVTLDDDTVQDWGEMPEVEVEISKAEGNALTEKSDGLFVPASAVEYSKDEKNIAKAGSDGGIYVPETDLSDLVEKEDGKGLSTNDYDDNAKAKVDAIPEDPKYTDTVYDDTEVREEIGKKVDKEDGKGLSTNDYDAAAKAKVDAIPENPKYTDTVYDDTEVKEEIGKKVDKVDGKDLSTNDYTDEDKAEVEKVKDKVDVQQKAEDKGKILGIDENGKVTPVTGGGVQIDDTSTDATDKTWSVKKIFDSIKDVFTNHTIKAINMYDDVDITSEGNGLHVQYSDTEMTLNGNDIIIHNIAGGESRVTLKDGSLLLEGAPYWDKNPEINMVGGENEDVDRSRIDMFADNINLNGVVKVNGQGLGQATRIITVVGAYHQNEGNYLTAKELWDAGITDGTYLVHAHSSTSNSSCLFWGYISIGPNGFDDNSFSPISGTRLWCDYSTERLYYTGGDIGSVCSMDFIRISNYVDN